MRRKITYEPRYDFYQMIGVETKADAETIQRAYRQRAKELHPDLNQDRAEWATDQFQRLNEAYSVLSDPDLRRRYDELRWPYLNHSGAGPARSSPYRTPYSPRYAGYRRSSTRYPPPVSAIRRGQWLEKQGIGWARPAYLALADLLTSPYRYVLMLLTGAVAVNLVLILSGFLSGEMSATPAAGSRHYSGLPTVTLNNPAGGLIPAQTVAPTVTPLVEAGACQQYAVIQSPADGALLTRDIRPLVGTVNHPNLYSFEVVAAYLGANPDGPTQYNIILREAHTEGPPEPPFIESTLVPLTPLADFAPGYYRVRLTAVQQDGSPLASCSIMLYKE